ncbi:hypothetical protein Tco_1457816 [Tanacetum coccineum]
MDDDTTHDEQVQSTGDEDIGHDHIPTVNLRQNWWKPLTEDRPATPEPAWSIPHTYTKMEECHVTLTDQVDESNIQVNVIKPLHWLVQPGQVIIQSLLSSQGLRVSKIRSQEWQTCIVNFEEQMVPDQMWIEEEIARDFKYLYPSDFEDLYLLNLQGHLNHLPPEDKKILTTAVNLWTRNLVIRQCVEDFQLGIESYQTQLNLTKPRWDATGFEFKHDFTVIDSPRAVTFRDKYEIDEALDYRVKEFKVNRMNPGLNTRFWTRKDVDRSKEFMFAIQKRLKTRRIFRNLESFVGGRIREGDYRLLKRTE